MTVRKGLLVYKNLRAEEYKGEQRVFRGRIAVDRGSGVTEFPNPSQFGRIAKEEGIASDQVRRAFSHMRGLKANPGRGGGGTHKKVRRGLLSADQDDWVAQELPPSADPSALGMPEDKRIMITRGGTWEDGGIMAGLVDPGQLLKAARGQGFTATEVKRAFGHLKASMSAPGAKTAPRVVDHFGPRRMGLGHFDPSSGQVKGGVRKGSLILFDKRSGRTPWAAQVIPSESRQGHKSILIRFHGKSHDLTFEQAFAGVGLRGGARKELSAAARNIPAIAFLNAFSFLLPKAEARRLYHEAGARS
jgi:hypothetical protein